MRGRKGLKSGITSHITSHDTFTNSQGTSFREGTSSGKPLSGSKIYQICPPKQTNQLHKAGGKTHDQLYMRGNGARDKRTRARWREDGKAGRTRLE